MTEPQNNRERLLFIRKGLESILDEYREERKRWLDTLGSETDLATFKLNLKIKHIDNLLTELATVLYTDYSRGAETANGIDPDKRGVPTIEGNVARKVSRIISRWQKLSKTTPSGKTLFCCRICLRESPTPDKRCPTMDCEGIEKRMVNAVDYEPLVMGLTREEYEAELQREKQGEGTGEEMIAVPFEISEPFEGAKEVAEKLGEMIRREGAVAPVPGGAGIHYDCPDIITTLRKPEGELDDIEFTILKTRKPEVDISGAAEACAESARERAIQERLDRVKRGSQRFHVPPETMEEAVALRGESIKDRIAATEAEALARKAPVHSMNLGAADTPRKHTAQNISQLRAIVKKALELSVTDRLNIFDALGLFDVKTGKCFGAVQGIQEAFQRAQDLGKVKLGALIAAIERVYDEQQKTE